MYYYSAATTQPCAPPPPQPMCALCTFHLLYHRCTPPTNALSRYKRERERAKERGLFLLYPFPGHGKGALFPPFLTTCFPPDVCKYTPLSPPLCFRVCYVRGPSLSLPISQCGLFRGRGSPFFRGGHARGREESSLSLFAFRDRASGVIAIRD